jgi:hypothetical protein
MSTRVISDRELVHNLRFEVHELREQLAELGAQVARLGVLVGDDEALGSRRAPALERCGALGILGYPCVSHRGHDGAHWYGA